MTAFISKVPKPQLSDFESESDRIYRDKSKVKEIWANKSKSKNGKQKINSLQVIEEDMMGEFSGEFAAEIVGDNQVLVEALQMGYSNPKTLDITIMNEKLLTEADFKTFSTYEQLKSVNLSMNSLSSVPNTGKRSFKDLRKLNLSQNKLVKFEKSLFDKLPNLDDLTADINLLNSMDGIES